LHVRVTSGTVLLTAANFRGLLRLAPAADGLPGDPAHGTSFPEF
jgi:hypothetical protein